MNRIERALSRLASDLQAIGSRWVLVGGIAVSLRAEPRTTRDVDVMIAVPGDQEAERVALALRLRGYRDHPEGAAIDGLGGRLATIRLVSPAEEGEESGIEVDLLIACTGVEEEVVVSADLVELVRGLVVPVAKASHLLALKVLAGRLKDQIDAYALLKEIVPADLRITEEILKLITQRGFHRGKDLLADLARLQETLE